MTTSPTASSKAWLRKQGVLMSKDTIKIIGAAVCGFVATQMLGTIWAVIPALLGMVFAVWALSDIAWIQLGPIQFGNRRYAPKDRK